MSFYCCVGLLLLSLASLIHSLQLSNNHNKYSYSFNYRNNDKFSHKIIGGNVLNTMNRLKRNQNLKTFYQSSLSLFLSKGDPDSINNNGNVTITDGDIHESQAVTVATETTVNNSDNNIQEEDLSYAYKVLFILFVAFASNQWSRQAIYYLCDFSTNADAFRHINADIHFSKDMYASLASFGFTAIFAFVSLFAGSISDQFNRRNVLALSCLVWSIITGLHSQARSFTDLIPLRALLGISQAFFNPAAYTLIADLFPKRLVGSINGIFSSGIYLGGGLASLSILLDNQVGWRATMLSIGLIGIVIAGVCVAVVRDHRYETTINKNLSDLPVIINNDIKNNTKGKQTSNLSFDIVSTMSTSYQSVLDVLTPLESKLLLSATVIRFLAGFSIAIWKAPFVFAQFPGSENLFAGSNALIVSIGGLSSSLLGGYLSDKLANPVPLNRDSSSLSASSSPPLSSSSTSNISDAKVRSRSWIPAIGSLLSAPLWAGFILAPTPELAAVFLFLEYLGNKHC